ncbi:hypothetical protein I5R75_08135 [Pseudomonas aeruginosa]|nr:hypothetical protein [Pseudomonas aeruginosa]
MANSVKICVVAPPPGSAFDITKLALDDPEWIFNLGENLDLGFLDLARRFVQHAAFAVLF